jgi:hypothetical protein
VAVTLVVTGMQKYSLLSEKAPLADAFSATAATGSAASHQRRRGRRPRFTRLAMSHGERSSCDTAGSARGLAAHNQYPDSADADPTPGGTVRNARDGQTDASAGESGRRSTTRATVVAALIRVAFGAFLVAFTAKVFGKTAHDYASVENLSSPCVALGAQALAAYAVDPTGLEASNSASGVRTCTWKRGTGSDSIVVVYGSGKPAALNLAYSPFAAIPHANQYVEFDQTHMCETQWPTSYGYVSVSYFPVLDGAGDQYQPCLDRDAQLALAVAKGAPS